MRLTLHRTTALLALLCMFVGTLFTAHARQSPTETTCISNLRQMALGLMMYTQDYDQRLPPMKSVAGTQKQLFPYVKNTSIFICPDSGKPFKVNPAVGGKKLSLFKSPATTVTLYDPAPHGGGTWVSVAYLDGHVKRSPKLPSLKVGK